MSRHLIRSLLVVPMLAAITVACDRQTSTQPSPMAMPQPNAITSSGESTTQGSANGVAGSVPAYYDDQLFTINLKDQPTNAQAALLAHNGSINKIYRSDMCEAAGHPLIAVLDAIQGDGFNPLWQEVQLVFPSPSACTQFTSDNDILAAAAAKTITLQPMNEVYRCAVIGKK